jgi:hypothetical protein
MAAFSIKPVCDGHTVSKPAVRCLTIVDNQLTEA